MGRHRGHRPNRTRSRSGNGTSTGRPESVRALADAASDEPSMPGAGGKTFDPKGGLAPTGWDEIASGPYEKAPAKDRLLREYWEMAHFEPGTRRILATIRSLLVSKIGAYEHPDPNSPVRDLVTRCIDRLEGGIEGLIGDLLSSMWAGFSVIEPVWDATPDGWYIRRADMLHPMTFFGKYGEPGIAIDPVEKRVAQVVQNPVSKGSGEKDTSVAFPVADVLYWPLMREVREQVYGNSMLAGARRSWYSIAQLEKYYNTFAMKCACPTPLYLAPNTTIKHPETQLPVAVTSFMAELLQRVSPGSGVVLPEECGINGKVVMETMFPVGTGEAFEKVLAYWQARHYASLLTPMILFEEPEHASRAQAGTIANLWYIFLEGIRRELERVLIDQFVKPQVVYNLGPQPNDNYGEWGWDPIDDADLQLFSSAFEAICRGVATLKAAGLMPTHEDMLQVRNWANRILGSSSDIIQRLGLDPTIAEGDIDVGFVPVPIDGAQGPSERMQIPEKKGWVAPGPGSVGPANDAPDADAAAAA